MKIALTLGFVVAFTQASGCTCNENVKEKDLIERADYAFIGEVISNVYLDSDSLTALLLQKRSVRPDAILKVTKIIKGRLLKEEVIVITSGSSCSMALIPGNQYLITGWTDSEKSKSSKIPESTKAKVDDMILYSNACYSRLKN